MGRLHELLTATVWRSGAVCAECPHGHSSCYLALLCEHATDWQLVFCVVATDWYIRRDQMLRRIEDLRHMCVHRLTPLAHVAQILAQLLGRIVSQL
jgi:hypothetical protein